ncbi:MAG: hypothetical protein KDD11_08605 [Acidobacteria bacterium]|nr:hypothetical protein [Acidobacteriota bacterium]
MEHTTDRQLMRLLHGELPGAEASELRRRLAGEPALAARLGELEAAWNGLELPPPAPVPVGFTGRVVARARRTPGAVKPRWAVAAVSLGLALGIGVGARLTTVLDPSGAATAWPGTTSGEIAAAGDDDLAPPASSLADEYWRAVDEVFGETEVRR